MPKSFSLYVFSIFRIIDVPQVHKSISIIFNENSVINYNDWFMIFTQNNLRKQNGKARETIKWFWWPLL